MLMQTKYLLHKFKGRSTLTCSRNWFILLWSWHSPPAESCQWAQLLLLYCYTTILLHIQIHKTGTACTWDLKLKEKKPQYLPFFALWCRFLCTVHCGNKAFLSGRSPAVTKATRTYHCMYEQLYKYNCNKALRDRGHYGFFTPSK